MKDSIRLDKCVTTNFGYSRKDAGKLIRTGCISVNGVVVKDASIKVSSTDVITFDGDEDVEELQVITSQQKRYFMINKPAGYICANEDSLNPIIFSLLDREIVSGLFCVGRLDLDTEGLLFITDDGEWSHRITSPKHHCDKTYEVNLAEPCPESAIELFKNGVELNGERNLTKPAILEIIEPNLVHLTIREGKYHQVKRMFAAIGNKVIGLKRISIGPVTLEDLEEGEYRELTSEEIEFFRK